MTDEDDIGFQIYFDPSARAENLSEMEAVYPYIRLECTSVPITDHFVAERPGNCTLLSSFSIFLKLETEQKKLFRCA